MVNGDEKNGIFRRSWYFFQCLRNQRKGVIDDSVTILTPTLCSGEILKVGPSPARLLCDAFWASLDYFNLEKELEGKLKFFDVGCGSGRYGYFLQKYSKSSFESYTGLDIYKDVAFPAEFKHRLGRVEESIDKIEDDVNVLISQSVMEHIKNDIEVLSAITGRLDNKGRPFIQIHMLPASASLWLYLWHGWRQYSLKNLCNIARILKRDFDVDVLAVPLVGRASFYAHLKYIVLYSFLTRILGMFNVSFQEQPERGNRILEKVASERECSDVRTPIFWGLIIVSRGLHVNFKI